MNGRACNIPPTLYALCCLLTAMCLGGCNLVTGADGLVIGEGDHASAEPPAGVGGEGAAPSSSGQGGVGAGDGTGGQGAAPISDALVVADGVSVEQIVLFQAVERPLMQNGAAVGGATPVVAERDALVRLFYTTDGGYDGQPVIARLSIDDHPPLEQQLTLTGTSNAASMGSTVNFDVPGGLLTVGASYRVDLLQSSEQSSGSNAAAAYPQSPEVKESFGAQASGRLTITLVPIAYGADGSGRLPDTSPAQVAAYADAFYAIYPISNIDIQVRSQPMSWGSTVSSNGNGWSELLNAVADLRNSDGVGFDEYYYGIFEPAGSISSYCGGGCVAGLGFVGGPSDSWARAAIGIGFSGDLSVDTAVHELGHNHGREHSPCGGAAGADPGYPYGGAKIGSWGYNLLTGQLYDPNVYVDLMSYCSPTWISDYNFRKIFDRVKLLNGADWAVPSELSDLTWDRYQLLADGSLAPMSAITLQVPPAGQIVPVQVDTQAGSEQLEGHFVRYDHIDGGVLFVPPSSHAKLSLQAFGTQLQLLTP